jgi:glycosyltransferase involved in cell wall biosynthesis
MPRVTVGMPVYNGARYLREALDCWLAQDFTDFELVVSDNGSTDATPALLDEYRRRDSRLRVLRRERTVPATENFNGLVGEAQGPYYAWAACDDLWEPRFLSTLVAALDARPEVVLAYCRVARVDAEGRPDGTFYYQGLPPGVEPDVLGRVLGILRRSRNHSMVYGLIRRDALLATALFRTQLGIANDVAFCLELATRGPFECVPEVLFRYRVHEAAVHVKRDDVMYAGGRGRRLDAETERFVRALPLQPIEQALLLRELRVWCDKGRRPRPLPLRVALVRRAWVGGRRGIIDALRWYHGV